MGINDLSLLAIIEHHSINLIEIELNKYDDWTPYKQ